MTQRMFHERGARIRLVLDNRGWRTKRYGDGQRGRMFEVVEGIELEWNASMHLVNFGWLKSHGWLRVVA